MSHSRHGVVTTVLALTLWCVASTAMANSISPRAYFMPGVLPIAGMEYALLASALAAVIERPFFVRAGVVDRSLRRSLQANLLSHIAGFVLAMFMWFGILYLGFFWLVLAVAVSVAIEGKYLEGKLPADTTVRPQAIRWPWVIAGNVVSSIVVAAIPGVTLALKVDHPEWSWTHREVLQWPSYRALYWSATLGSAAAFIWACWPVREESKSSQVEPTG